MLKIIYKLLLKLIIVIVDYQDILKKKKRTQDINLLLSLPKSKWVKYLLYLKKSKSQLRQDLMVASYLKYKKKGYFVEFGATNGKDLSNTYLLEKEFLWTGILAEPAKIWHREIKKNRSANINFNCVYSKSNIQISFVETKISELSTIAKFSETDSHMLHRKNGKIYNVKSISLEDLLKKYNAPINIDYLSIDTEGSEYEILKNFDFQKYRFNIITCEHNYGANRKKIFTLLSKNGYERKFKNLSKFDDWYFKK